MTVDRDRTAIIRALEELLDRLCAPDLTLGEAKDLLPQLADLLASLDDTMVTAAIEPATVGTSG